MPGRRLGAGDWDPSPAIVLAGAVGVAVLGDLAARRLPRPALDATFQIPKERRIDAPLVIGSAVFGIGWGLSGFCPSPAVAALSTRQLPVVVFAGAMPIGMAAHRAFAGDRSRGSDANAPGRQVPG